MTENHPQIIESLGISEKVVHSDSLPTIDDLHTLANKAKETKTELGVSIYMVSAEEKMGSTYNIGSATSIYEPEPPNKYKGKIEAGLFIHCHPVPDSKRVKEGRPLHILPSGGEGRFVGDFAANVMSRVVGGYLNIASEYGLTMSIGIEGISREDDLTRKMRKKLGAYKKGNEKTWKILSGEKAGVSMVGNEYRAEVDKKFSIGDDVVLLSHTQELGIRYFLHTSWDKLKELESIYGGVENLCFGDGLQALLKELNISVPHEKNLSTAAKKILVTPKSR